MIGLSDSCMWLLLVGFKLSGYDTAFGFQKWDRTYGENCSSGYSDNGCNIGFSMTCLYNREKGFRTCGCLPVTVMKYNKRAEIECSFPTLSFYKTCKKPCPDDQVCTKGTCTCKNDTMVLVDEKCYEVQFEKPLEACYVENLAYLCDYRNNSFCKSRKCVCFGKHFYNSTSQTCQQKSDSLNSSVYGSVRYKAVPGEYCLVDSDCADGLNCHDTAFKCNCPGTCKYLKEDGVCDCGQVKLEAPTGVMIVGFILGLLSVAFWTRLIFKACDKRKPKHTQEPQEGNYNATSVEMNAHSQLIDEPVFVDENQDAKNQVKEHDLPPSYAEAVVNPPNAGLPQPFFPPAGNTGCEFTPWKAAATSPGLTQPPPSYPASQTVSTPYPVSPLPNTPYPPTPQANDVTSQSNTPYPSTPQTNTPYPSTQSNTSYPSTQTNTPYPLTPPANALTNPVTQPPTAPPLDETSKL